MAHSLIRIRPRWSLLLLPLLLFTASFSPAETAATAPLGAVVASPDATIGKFAATAGNTIFAGDQVTSKEPALISFISGSGIEMTKATAKFNRTSNALVVDVAQGLIRFNFKKGEEVQINAGECTFTTVGDIGSSGELGLNRSSQIEISVAVLPVIGYASAPTTIHFPLNWSGTSFWERSVSNVPFLVRLPSPLRSVTEKGLSRVTSDCVPLAVAPFLSQRPSAQVSVRRRLRSVVQ